MLYKFHSCRKTYCLSQNRTSFFAYLFTNFYFHHLSIETECVTKRWFLNFMSSFSLRKFLVCPKSLIHIPKSFAIILGTQTFPSTLVIITCKYIYLFLGFLFKHDSRKFSSWKFFLNAKIVLLKSVFIECLYIHVNVDMNDWLAQFELKRYDLQQIQTATSVLRQFFSASIRL